MLFAMRISKISKSCFNNVVFYTFKTHLRTVGAINNVSDKSKVIQYLSLVMENKNTRLEIIPIQAC